VIVAIPVGINILGPMVPEYEAILTPAALAFIADLARTFEPRRQTLLEQRQQRWQALKAGLISLPKRHIFVAAIGRLRQSLPILRTAAPKSPAQPIAAW
jgi:malate synthase